MDFFKRNVGGIDRVLRIAAGAALLVWALAGGPIWTWLGLIPALTGIFGYCPLYAPLGFSTCRTAIK